LLQNAVQLKTAQTKKTKQQASAHMAGKRWLTGEWFA
jgi:hypothetical protein